MSTWEDYSTDLTVSHCSKTTILKPTNGATSITRIHSNLSPHYKLRIRVSVWWPVGGAAADKVTITISNSTNSSIKTADVTPSSNNLDSGVYTCTGYATNTEVEFTEQHSDQITVVFSSSATDWGIREYVLI